MDPVGFVAAGPCVIGANGWRDLGLVRRLVSCRVCPHSEDVLTSSALVLRKSLAGLVVYRVGLSALVGEAMCLWYSCVHGGWMPKSPCVRVQLPLVVG